MFYSLPKNIAFTYHNLMHICQHDCWFLILSAPMLKDKISDLRVFYGWFFVRPKLRHDTFVWWANESYLTVTVDYTQSGTSPEVDECKSRSYATRNLFQVIPF